MLHLFRRHNGIPGVVYFTDKCDLFKVLHRIKTAFAAKETQFLTVFGDSLLIPDLFDTQSQEDLEI